MIKGFFLLIATTSIAVLLLLSACTKDSPMEIPDDLGSMDSTRSNVDTMLTNLNCDTSETSYSSFIIPLISDYCLQCHSGNAPFGGVHLDSYAGVKKVADSGKFYGALSWQPGYEAMPQGADRLLPCELQNVNAWVNAGALNN